MSERRETQDVEQSSNAPPFDQRVDTERFKHLPEHVRIEDTVALQETREAKDPDGGRDPERDFMIRYAG